MLQRSNPFALLLHLPLFPGQLLTPLRHLPTHLLQLSLHLLKLFSRCLARCLRCRHRLATLLQLLLQFADSSLVRLQLPASRLALRRSSC